MTKRKKKLAFDKVLHLIAGFVISIIAGIFGGFLQTAIGTSPLFTVLIITALPLLAGYIKEARDAKQPGNRFDPYDMIATWIGAAPMIIPAWAIYLNR